jgi:small subunit ribosomal protein S17
MTTTEQKSEARRRGQRLRLVGNVKRASAPKTIVVSVERHTVHKTYGAYVKRSKSYLVHDERGECQVGDRVEIIESRPLSARKRWRVRRIVKQGTRV